MTRILTVNLSLIVLPVAALCFFALVNGLFFFLPDSSIMYLIIGLCVVLFWWPAGTGVYLLTRNRNFKFLSKKKHEEVPAVSLFNSAAWYRSLLARTAAWVFIGLGLALAVFIGQSQAHQWFQTLLINHP